MHLVSIKGGRQHSKSATGKRL